MSTTDLAQQVADLTTATTKLTQEVVGQKDRLTAAADTATGKSGAAAGSAQAAAQSVTDAAAEVTKATNQANTAGIEADRAKTEADRASEVSGLDTVEQAVDMALGEFAGLMSESEARAINRINEAKYDASGFVHMGKAAAPAVNTVAVNEGMYSYTHASNPNSLIMGRTDLGAGNQNGTSKSLWPVAHIAGAVLNVLYSNATYAADFRLPEAEDGTRIYDSTGDCRGSGKASLNLKVDVDPKYGDIPTGTEEEILREAVGRAFDGSQKNSDFRLGDNVDWYTWESYPTNTRSVLDGVTTLTSGSADYIGCFNDLGVDLEDGVEYEFSVDIISANGGGGIGQVRVGTTGAIGDGSFSEIISSGDAKIGENVVRFTTTSGRRFLFIGGRNDVTELVFRNATLRKVTEEVVTHPVDLVGLEYYEEELTGRQEIFECIQSLSATFGTTSVPTVLSTRKLSYFQQYDGQFPEVTADPDYINDRYRCVVWDDLTEPQKREVASYMGEKLFVGVNGHIVNGRLRALTERLGGDGDWLNISSLSGTLQYDANSKVKPRGNQDVATTGQYGHDPMNRGVFKSSNASVAYQGRCYLYVIGQRS